MLVAGLLQGPADTVPADDPLQVSLITMGPGRSVYERFGHNAIGIRNRETGEELVYNYGTFDFAEPGFVGRFIQGRPRYWLAAAPMDWTVASYRAAGRSVVAQELALPPEVKAELAFRLYQNSLPENRTYVYDYYLDNCSTRVRDMLDLVLGGALSEATRGRPAGGNLRFHTQRSVSNNPFFYLGILAAMGPAVDRPLDQWGEMFLPRAVHDRVAELTVDDGAGGRKPLVASTTVLVADDRWPVEETRPDWSLPLLFAGAAVAALILSARLGGVLGGAGRLAGTIWCDLQGIGSLVLLYLWFGTDHVATAGNWNLLLFTPLAVLVVPVWWMSRRPAWGRTVVRLYLLSVVLGALLAFLGLVPQAMGEIAALMILPSLAVGVVLLTRPPAGAPPLPR